LIILVITAVLGGIAGFYIGKDSGKNIGGLFLTSAPQAKLWLEG
jgi:hypothetical protein